MQPRSDGFVAGLVLAAGGSKRLGAPKQLLPYGGGTLLGHVVANARECGFDQLVVTLGAGANEVRAAVDLDGTTVVENRAYGEGCSSSIAAALPALDERWEVLVLMLGDQPGVLPATVRALLDGRGTAPLGVCRYENGRGHPFVFQRSAVSDLAVLRGDKAVWKLLEQRAAEVREVPVPGPVPRDVDTWDDYEALLASVA